MALLAAAALPPSGGSPRFSLEDGPEPPFSLLDRAELAGSVACWWGADLVPAMNGLDALRRCLAALAFLPEAAGVDLLAWVGRLLAVGRCGDGG